MSPLKTEEIIHKIRQNRISTTEVADCMNKTGLLSSRLYALNARHFKVGRVKWTYAINESNWEHHEQVADIDPGFVVITEPFSCGERAIFGDLVTKYLMLYRQCEALVVLGKLRDIPHLIKENYPIWLEGVSPVGCFNTKSEKGLDQSIIEQRRAQYDDSIAVCDDSGVVIIPKELHTEEFLKKLDWIEEQEDIWFDCIDRRKWSTYDTVCLKKYLNEPESNKFNPTDNPLTK
jgi:4-hydroxy-4-methyl-2-oxoglutarate aldolase